MNPTYRNLLRHAAVYGAGTILSRVASFLLLPLYTRYLSPSDYACIAILDLTLAILAIVIGSGIAQAANRFHHTAVDDKHQDRIWWTALTFQLATATCVVAPAWIVRSYLAELVLGSNQADGTLLFAIALPTLWLNSIGYLLETYLRVRKWSRGFVAVSLGRLLLNVALNVAFLTHLNLGAVGVLAGNLITGAVVTAFLMGVLALTRGSYKVDLATWQKLWSFGGPLIVTSLLALLMHQVDRYVLRASVGMDQIGVYSLAYQIGYGVNSLLLLPFGSIWGVMVYEIAEQSDADAMYRRIFQYFSSGLMLALLATALVARPLVATMADEAYAEAADLVPVICLAYFFFSITSFMDLPMVLAGRTRLLLISSSLAATVSVGGNLLIDPHFGIQGAAWVGVLTFVVLASTNAAIGRKLRTIGYPAAPLVCKLLFAVLCYWVYLELIKWGMPAYLVYSVAVGMWCGAAAILMREPMACGRQWLAIRAENSPIPALEQR